MKPKPPVEGADTGAGDSGKPAEPSETSSSDDDEWMRSEVYSRQPQTHHFRSICLIVTFFVCNEVGVSKSKMV